MIELLKVRYLADRPVDERRLSDVLWPVADEALAGVLHEAHLELARR
jgi:hypothetical protein